jgi:hypothetical protein
MRKLVIALVLLPLVAVAQGPASGSGSGQGAGVAPAPGPRGLGAGRGDPQAVERRMRLARTLGLAEALDLDSAQALKLGDQVARFDEKRLAAHRQLRDAHDVLRRAASGEKTTQAEVDQAIQRALAARAQLQTIDRDTIATITKDLTPEKKARAVLFLQRFQGRYHPGMMGGPGKGGRGHHGMRGGMGGKGMMGMGPQGACLNPDCPWMGGDDESD